MRGGREENRATEAACLRELLFLSLPRARGSEGAQLLSAQLQIKPTGVGSFRYALRVGLAAAFYTYCLFWIAGMGARGLDMAHWCQHS